MYILYVKKIYIHTDIHTYVYMIYTCSVFRIRAAFAWIMLVWFGSWHVCCLTRRAQVRAVCIYCSLAIKVGSCIENDRKNLLEVLRPRCRNLECCCLKVDCSRTVLRGSHFRTDFRSQCIVVSTRYSSCAWYPFRSDCGLHPSCLFLTETENSKIQGTILSLIRSIICLSWFNHFPVWYQTSCIWHHLAWTGGFFQALVAQWFCWPDFALALCKIHCFLFPLIYLDSHSTWLDYSWLLILLQSRRKHLQCCYSVFFFASWPLVSYQVILSQSGSNPWHD